MRLTSRWSLALIALAPVLACVVGWLVLDEPRWSGLGQWVGGIATAGAVVVAIQVFAEESRRVRDERLDHETAQARLVTVHMEHPNPEAPFPAYKLVIENHSAFPVLEPQFEGIASISGVLHFEWGYDEDAYEYPGMPPILKAHDRDVAALWFRPVGQEDVGGPGRPPVGDPTPHPIISFTDAEGRRWRRVGSGSPERVLPSVATK